MTLGLAERQTDLLDTAKRLCDETVEPTSIYALMHRERDQLFPDEMFEDLFATRGRRSVPPSIVATVMVLQRLEGCSDREAVDRATYDLRWRYAADVGDDYRGFVHTVLVDMRARLRESDDPDRVFRVTTEFAASHGLLGTKRVLDSAPLYDAVATQDTVTLIRGAVRGLLRVCPSELETELRGLLQRDDDYLSSGKPVCDWDDKQARDELIDELVNDALDALEALEGRDLAPEIKQAAELLATVVGQDVDQDIDGVFRIARRTAPDRVISTVDTDARHGHKSSARGFDGYKGHVAIDPDSEIITAAAVGPANAGDGDMLAGLIEDVVPVIGGNDAQGPEQQSPDERDLTDRDPSLDADDTHDLCARVDVDDAEVARSDARTQQEDPVGVARHGAPVVYGDSAYGSGANLALLEAAGAVAMVKVQAPTAPGGRFRKDRFAIDLDSGSVTCPNGVTAPIVKTPSGEAYARFGNSCDSCPLRDQCTTSSKGRVVSIGPHEALLARERERQQDGAWKHDYRATRPKVERKLAHMLRRRHGGRRARVRGTARADQDWKLLGAATNLARLAVLLAAN